MKKWLVPIVCALPFVGVALWFVAGKNLGTLALWGFVLACPLSHIFLMKHDDHSGHKRMKGGEHR